MGGNLLSVEYEPWISTREFAGLHLEGVILWIVDLVPDRARISPYGKLSVGGYPTGGSSRLILNEA